MSGFEEKRKRFELLMKQAELPAGLTDPYFVDGWIERVETNRSNREWHILIYKDRLVPAPIYRTFSLHIQEKMNHRKGLCLVMIFIFFKTQLANNAQSTCQLSPALV